MVLNFILLLCAFSTIVVIIKDYYQKHIICDDPCCLYTDSIHQIHQYYSQVDWLYSTSATYNSFMSGYINFLQSKLRVGGWIRPIWKKSPNFKTLKIMNGPLYLHNKDSFLSTNFKNEFLNFIFEYPCFTSL